MAKRTYTEAQRAEALALYETAGPTQVEAELGIPKQTVQHWARQRGIQTVRSERTAAAVEAQSLAWEQRRMTLVHRIGAVAELALDVATEKLADGSASAAKDAATTMAILVDKAQLLTGGATGHQRHTVTRDAVLEDARSRALSLVPDAA